MVLDFELIKNEDDLIEVLINLSPTYIGFELYRISEERAKNLLEKIAKIPNFPEMILITPL